MVTPEATSMAANNDVTPWRSHPRLAHHAILPNLPNSLPPLPNSRARDVQLPGDFRVAHPLPTIEHDPGAHRHRLRRFWPARDQAQLLAVRVNDLQRFLRT